MIRNKTIRFGIDSDKNQDPDAWKLQFIRKWSSDKKMKNNKLLHKYWFKD